MIPRYYKTRELADLLAVSEDTIRQLARKGEIESVRVGSDRRYPEPSVRAYLDRQRVRPWVAPVVEIAARREARS